MSDSQITFLLLCLAAMAAGAVNSIAGGGTLLTFPSLLSAVSSSVVANATSTVALVPGSLASGWAYRREMQAARHWLMLLLWPSLLGGAVGALLVTRLEEKYFEALIPWLLLTAATLFLLQPLIARFTGIGKSKAHPSLRTQIVIAFFQFLVSVYGGYFGAGIGILMLSSLSFMGISDIHQMNALKSILGTCINGVAVVVFVVDGKVNWHYAIVMAAAAILGGFLGAHYARRLNPNIVRWLVIVIGFGLAAHFFYRQWFVGNST
ncbi:MAG TPA: sulfite exporter TauE/SafE family protein [Gemmataceae bacterium]|jgi:hypothetical protein|nr:sulfite exporter TauE/SafE family protein [Gemmataceae bacterium]